MAACHRELFWLFTAIALSCCAPSQQAGQPSAGRAGVERNGALSIFAATLSEVDVATRDSSTDEMDEIIRLGDAIVLDTRPRLEWAIGHLPTAVNVAPKPGTSISLYVSDVAEIERIAGGDKRKPLVLYCNGPFCGKSKRLAGELIAAGYANVRRYQLGVWRALGKVMVIEAEGVRYVLAGAGLQSSSTRGSAPNSRWIRSPVRATSRDRWCCRRKIPARSRLPRTTGAFQ